MLGQPSLKLHHFPGAGESGAPVWLAAPGCHESVTRLFSERGADVNTQGDTVFQSAYFWRGESTIGDVFGDTLLAVTRRTEKKVRGVVSVGPTALNAMW